MSVPGPRLTVVVPTLDEAACLPALLGDLARLGEPHVTIVVDGGSGDGTRSVARAAGATVLCSPAGRAHQLRAGASAAATPWILFLHADSRLPADAGRELARFLDAAGPDRYAHFRFALEGTGTFWRFLEFGQRLRERWFGLVYGDQGLLVSRALYERAGGYPRWPLFEDVGLLDRLSRTGVRIRLDAELPTSPRRYVRDGRWTGWLRNTLLVSLFRLGVAPERLASWYERRPATATDVRAGAVALFAKAPWPGRVKTRLAAEIGTEQAVRVYRMLGRRVTDALRDGGLRPLVYFDPPDASAERDVRAWLGGDGIDLRPQSPGDLGARMSAAVEECLADHERVCVVGTDIPGIDAGTVCRAFAMLDEADVVLGPAHDGGYYLIALDRTHPELFRDVPWSTDGVLATTLARCRGLGLTPALLEPMTDVDTAADLPSGLRSA